MNFSLSNSKCRWRTLLVCCLFVVLTVLVYGPGLSGGFILDDMHAVSENTAIQVDRLDLESISHASRSFHGGVSGREIPMATFAIDYYFWQEQAFGYKISSLLVHLVNALLIFILVGKLLRLDSSSDSSSWPSYSAALIALVWAIHPLQTSTVLYVVQRMEMLAIFFVLLGLLAYVEGRRRQLAGERHGWLWVGGAGLTVIPGYFSKESAVLLPLFALGLEWAVLRFRSHECRDTRILKVLYMAGTVLAISVFLAIVVPRYTDSTAFVGREFSWYERLLSQLRALPMYLSWMIWPDPGRYVFFYDSFQHSTGWGNPITTALGGVAVLSLAIVAMVVRRTLPLFSLGVAWFLFSHALTSNIFPLELVFEHRNYFALLGILLALAALLHAIAIRFWMPAPRILATVMVLGLASLTWVHAATWGDSINLAMDLKAKNPDSARAGYQLGQEFLHMSDGFPDSPFFGMAESEFQRVRHFKHSSPMVERTLIEMRLVAGRPVDEELWSDFVKKIESQAPAASHVNAVYDLLSIYNRGGALDEDYLLDAGIALLNSGRMHPHIFVELVVFVVEGIQDQDLASQIFVIGSSAIQSEAWDQAALGVLRRRGHEQFVFEIESRLFGPSAEDD